MTELNFSEAEVRFYLEALLGKNPVRDEKGYFLLDCPFAVHPGVFIHMNPNNGQFYCRGGCARGELAVFEVGRAKISSLGEARRAVLRIIEAEKDKIRLAEQAAKEKALLAEQEAKAALDKATEGLPPDVKKLFGMVARHPGRSRRYLQQSSHAGAYGFRKAIRYLERSGLVTWKDQPVSGGKARRVYFPVVLSQQPSTQTTDSEASC